MKCLDRGRNSTSRVDLRSDRAEGSVQNLVIVFIPKLQTSLISGGAASAIWTVITNHILPVANTGIEEGTPITKTGKLA